MTNRKPKFLPRIEGVDVALPTGSGNPFETDEEEDIFKTYQLPLNIQRHCAGDISHLAVSKNWLVCVVNTGERTKLLRLFLNQAIPPGEIALEKYLSGSGYKISKIFLDPTGHHIIASLVPKSTGLSADFLYIYCTESSTGQTVKLRRIEKFKDHEITAVAFNKYNGDKSTTSAILLGTSRGLIFETELSPTSDTVRKQLYDLGLGRIKYPITGLELLRVPNSQRHIVVVTAPDCIYSFQDTLKPEERSLEPIFARYVGGLEEINSEERKTDLNFSQLCFFAPPNSKYPKQWAWLCGAGIRVGELSIDTSAKDTLLGDTLISLDFKQGRPHIPKAFVLTEYHALLLYADHVKGICLLNQEVVYNETFEENSRTGKLLNIERDPVTGTIYLYTDKTIYHFRITDEERNIWRIYLEKGQYELATAHAAEVPEHLELVLSERADAAFAAGKYQTAADYYAETDKAFEEVCLKFMSLSDKRPIVNYIKRRLNRLATYTGEPDEHVETSVKALIIWLVDLYLVQINMPDAEPSASAAWQAQYDEFMKDPFVLTCTRKHHVIIQKLIEQHADRHNLAQFAISIGDYQEVIAQQLNAGRYVEALQTLRKQQDADLFYEYTPKLLEHLPKQTVEVLMEQGKRLDLEKLVPTLIVIDTQQQREQVMRYLEFAIYNLNNKVEVIHNYLLHLYAQHDHKKLMKYLKIQGTDETLVYYDVVYALKICTELNVKEACVFLKCMLCMWTSAVELALEFDITLAKETACRPKEKDLQRKLWLCIAHHEITGTNDVKKALNLLKESDLLSIEDLLPFFSDFEKIDDFKEVICDALQAYNTRIQELQHEMSETSEQTKLMCDEMEQLSLHSIRIDSQDVCSICEAVLIVKPFFAFVCGHKFHSDCLEKQVLPLLSKQRSRDLTMLKQQMESLMTQTAAMVRPTTEQREKRAELKAEIEQILAADCFFCGLLIETVDQPFVEDWDQGNVEWD